MEFPKSDDANYILRGSLKVELIGGVVTFCLGVQIDLAKEQANTDVLESGRGVPLSQGTSTVEFLFDFLDLPGCKGADYIGQRVNMQFYKCHIQSVTHIFVPCISVCVTYLHLLSTSYYSCNLQSGKTLGSYHGSGLTYILPFFFAVLGFCLPVHLWVLSYASINVLKRPLSYQ